MVKRISAFAAVLCCAFILCSCSVSRSQISAYVRGTLDSVYLNKNSAEYLEMIGGTAEECEAEYKQYIARSSISSPAWISTRSRKGLISAW